MQWRTRTRAIGVISLVWAGACGLIGSGMVLRSFILHPSVIRTESVIDGLRYVSTWMAIGGVCGAAFSLFVLAFVRRRPVGSFAALPITASVASLAFLIGALTDGSKVGTGLAAVAAALAFATLCLTTRRTSAVHASVEQAT